MAKPIFNDDDDCLEIELFGKKLIFKEEINGAYTCNIKHYNICISYASCYDKWYCTIGYNPMGYIHKIEARSEYFSEVEDTYSDALAKFNIKFARMIAFVEDAKLDVAAFNQ